MYRDMSCKPCQMLFVAKFNSVYCTCQLLLNHNFCQLYIQVISYVLDHMLAPSTCIQTGLCTVIIILAILYTIQPYRKLQWREVIVMNKCIYSISLMLALLGWNAKFGIQFGAIHYLEALVLQLFSFSYLHYLLANLIQLPLLTNPMIWFVHAAFKLTTVPSTAYIQVHITERYSYRLIMS